MTSKLATLRDLQAKCEAMGLDTRGEKADLLKRLKRSNLKGTCAGKQPAESESFSECDGLLATKSDIAGEEEMKDNAREALQKALDEEQIGVDEVGGDIVIGNRRGLDILHTLKQSLLRIDALEATVEVQGKNDEVQKAQIHSLEDRVQGLCASLEDYKKVRARYLSTHKRDVLKTHTDEDLKIIGSGNRSAHGGDALMDAQLYKGSGGRSDYKTYRSLYGLIPSTVHEITHPPTIAVLNKHASIVSSKYEVPSNEFRTLFAEFIRAFEEEGEGYDESYLDDNHSNKVKTAYWAFLNCIKSEVSKVEPTGTEMEAGGSGFP